MAFLAAIPAMIGSFTSSIGVGTALSAGGALLGGVGALQAGMYQSAVAQNNARIAEQNAQRASEQAQLQQIQSDNELAAFVGAQEAAQSASGLSVEGRSQMLTRRSAQRIGRQDSLNIARAGQAESRNFLQQAADFRGEAAQARVGGMMGLAGGVLGAGASLVGGSSPVRSATARSMRSNRIPLPNRTSTTYRPRVV